MPLSNIEISVKPNQLYEESEHMIQLVSRMREQMETAQQVMRATEGYWKGEAGDLHRSLFLGQKENLEKSLLHIELKAKDLAEIAGNYLEEDFRSASVSEALPSNAIV